VANAAVSVCCSTAVPASQLPARGPAACCSYEQQQQHAAAAADVPAAAGTAWHTAVLRCHSRGKNTTTAGINTRACHSQGALPPCRMALLSRHMAAPGGAIAQLLSLLRLPKVLALVLQTPWMLPPSVQLDAGLDPACGGATAAGQRLISFRDRQQPELVHQSYLALPQCRSATVVWYWFYRQG
jgi:hypothetical protein